jgi:glycosyltransferase involved in cell wall biosynthesis
MAKKVIVISGINITHGGPLSILNDLLDYLTIHFGCEYEIIALVPYRKLVNIPGVRVIEFPSSKISYLHKLYYEYFHFKKLASELKPLIWLSLSNITPQIEVPLLVSYIHNATPFYKITLRDLIFEPKIVLFHVLYKIFYRINSRIGGVFVFQSFWFQDDFKKLVQNDSNYKSIVCYPTVQIEKIQEIKEQNSNIYHFFYPSFPRIFKNFELIGAATAILELRGIKNFVVSITISKTGNRYEKMLSRKFGHLKNLKFVGTLSRKDVIEYYKVVDCLIFPSKLETWGLPLTEFKQFNKSILAADLPYAKETIGKHSRTKFFDVNNPNELATIMEQMMNGSLKYDITEDIQEEGQLVKGWKELFLFLLKNV